MSTLVVVVVVVVHRRLYDAVEQGVTVVQAGAYYAGCHSFGNIKGQTYTDEDVAKLEGGSCTILRHC